MRFFFSPSMVLSLGVTLAIFCTSGRAAESSSETSSVALYGGPAATAPLTSIIRLRDLGLEPFFITTLAYGRELTRLNEWIALEAESQLTFHHGPGSSPIAVNAAIVSRLHRTPWSSSTGGSFAVGAGVSHAFGIPEIERRELKVTSRTLIHLLFEYDVRLSREGPWSALLRVHHRSGGFGLCNGVSGGSDYLTTGLRFRW